jgi:EAL domain-containing protein (putative c-di-GMP-specific phosphodiesterase class I)/GGDEF domain-containing protein
VSTRDADFWRTIEQIFPPENERKSLHGFPGRGRRLSSYAHFMDRLALSAQRAQRHKHYVLLILLQLNPNKDRFVETLSDAHELLIYRVSSCLRSEDSVCSLGGGRFALLLEHISEPAVVPLVLEKLFSTLSGPAAAGKDARWAEANVGASLFPVDGLAYERIWASAETALDQALKSEAGAYRIAPMVTGQAAMDRFELSKDLYKAHRNNEFETVYQPIMDLGQKRIRAVESLMRWQHPARGILGPESFLPLLEESGVIVPVGERVLKDTCTMLRGLLDEGCPPLRACVNISARQLADSGFVLSVLDALYDADLDPGLLQLEFSESVLANRPELMQRVLPELQNAGVRLALDQFGTGEAPLAELVRLPIDLIKIDRTLIENLLDDAVSQAITSGTLALANAAGMRVAAVGVEQRQQTGLLEKLGCSEAQGCIYSSPLSGSELRTLLHT